jgi:hypothetical protein
MSSDDSPFAIMPNDSESENENDLDSDEFKEKFYLIHNEIQRQNEVIDRSNDIQTEKIGILLGFVFLILIQVSLTNDLADHPFSSNGALFIFYLGYLLIGISAIIGMTTYFVKTYDIGAPTEGMISDLRNGVKYNYKSFIFGKIRVTFNEQIEVNKRGALYLKAMISYFSIGVLLIVLPRMLNW